VTGASGLLGRELFQRLDGGDWQVRGLCWSRYREKLVRCDLTKEGEAEKHIEEFRPDILVHLVAERRPKVVFQETSKAAALNVSLTDTIAQACRKHNVWMIYISTDYVFDGTAPPYKTDASPNPLSDYGRQKLEGERAALAACHSNAVLRIPLLYGQVESLQESAVTVLSVDMKSASLGSADHLQKRYPTCTKDVASILEEMMQAHCRGNRIEGIYHWQGDECLTKYDMVNTIAEVQGIKSDVLPNLEPPKFPGPADSRLDCSRLIEELGIEDRLALFRTPFREALGASLREHMTEPPGDVTKAPSESTTCSSEADGDVVPTSADSQLPVWNSDRRD
jgi:dTDP-4-dehydrorhamnose reductase